MSLRRFDQSVDLARHHLRSSVSAALRTSAALCRNWRHLQPETLCASRTGLHFLSSKVTVLVDISKDSWTKSRINCHHNKIPTMPSRLALVEQSRVKLIESLVVDRKLLKARRPSRLLLQFAESFGRQCLTTIESQWWSLIGSELLLMNSSSCRWRSWMKKPMSMMMSDSSKRRARLSIW